jgi:hypothetical protein
MQSIKDRVEPEPDQPAFHRPLKLAFAQMIVSHRMPYLVDSQPRSCRSLAAGYAGRLSCRRRSRIRLSLSGVSRGFLPTTLPRFQAIFCGPVIGLILACPIPTKAGKGPSGEGRRVGSASNPCFKWRRTIGRHANLHEEAPMGEQTDAVQKHSLPFKVRSRVLYGTKQGRALTCQKRVLFDLFRTAAL